MSDIFKQIQELQEQFDNLFEVEGLGEPAVDVPPSQNKIKKDRKTKDGKVEVVSVEDELFPYEGNKREQYRQKILDTINAMIQGQATLEDLLQIVRQKKAPLKEAMELMEELLFERNKENKIKKNKAIEDIGQQYIDGRKEEGEDLDPYGDDPKQWGRDAVSGVGDTLGVKSVIPKLADKLEYSGISELRKKLRKKPFYDKEGRNKLIDGFYLHALNKAKKENSKEALKEAMELMENIYSQIEKAHGEPEWRTSRAGFVPVNKSAELQNKADKNGAKEEKQAAERHIKGTSMTYPEGEDFIDRKRHETKNKSLDDLPSDVLGHVGFDFKEMQDRKAKEATQKSITRHEKKNEVKKEK